MACTFNLFQKAVDFRAQPIYQFAGIIGRQWPIADTLMSVFVFSMCADIRTVAILKSFLKRYFLGFCVGVNIDFSCD